MHINLILGVVFIYLLYILGKRWLRREGTPRGVLREEMERERMRREGAAEGAGRLRDISARRVGVLTRALEEMRGELETKGREEDGASVLVEFDVDEGELYVRIADEGWKVRFEPAQVDLGDAANGSEQGLYVVEDAAGEREILRDDEIVVRHFARRIAKAAQG